MAGCPLAGKRTVAGDPLGQGRCCSRAQGGGQRPLTGLRGVTPPQKLRGIPEGMRKITKISCLSYSQERKLPIHIKISPNSDMITTFFLRPRCKATSLAKLALGAAVAVGALAAGSARAYVVTVGGVQYDVTTFTGTYNGNTSKFKTAANGGLMPWWGGSYSVADAFANAVGSYFGTPNTGATGTAAQGNALGPIFAYGLSSPFVNAEALCPTGCLDSPNASFAPFPTGDTAVYAQATLYTTPAAPAPLPLFGAAAAFGFSRQLRKRIKRAPGALVSGLPRA